MVVAVMKTLIVPRRSWSFIPALVGRTGYRVFHGIAVRMRSFDAADRLLGFLAPTVIITTLVALLAGFVLAFALLLLPWIDESLAYTLRESGSSVFTLGFVSSPDPIPTALNILGGATGMIFVALTIAYLPPQYMAVKEREALVKQLEGWTGTPSWGPELLARISLAGATGHLPRLYTDWDAWCADVADTHMKYPVLTQFRLPRSGNNWVVALLATMDAAALDMALRPEADHAEARLFLRQGTQCLADVAYPMRRIEVGKRDPGIDEAEFRKGVDRVIVSGFPAQRLADDAWADFTELRSHYAPLAYQLAFWTIAAPAPWSGERDGFPDLVAWPDSPEAWSLG